MKIFRLEQFKNIKINRFLLWRWGVVVFLALVAIILAINVRSFLRLENEMARGVSGIDFVPEQIKEKLLQDAIWELEEKEENFEDALSKDFQIQDPSMSP